MFRRLVLLALPARLLTERYAALLLMVTALAIMVVSRFYAEPLSALRAATLTVFAPVVSTLSEPATFVNAALHDMQDFAQLKSQNVQLREENEQLRDWHDTALRLQAENRSLKDLLNMKQDAELNYITARVIGDSGTSYVHSLLVKISPDNNVRRGMAVLSGQGLIGRIIDIDPTHHYARILLITDASSRIPVLMENSRQRAIATGDSSGALALDHLPEQTNIEVGERVITSGFDGIFPQGLPVGRIAGIDGNGVRIQPLSDMDRLDIVRLVDYGTVTDILKPKETPIIAPDKTPHSAPLPSKVKTPH